MPRRALTILLSCSILLLPRTAAADVLCRLELGVLSIEMSAPISPVTVVRSGDAIRVEDGGGQVDCGAPEPAVQTVEQVVVTDVTAGSSTFVIDLSGGPFASGEEITFQVALGFGSSDALVVGGSSLADEISLTPAGINLDGDPDPGPHVVLDSVERVAVRGGGGGDTIDAATDPFPSPVELHGEDGADTLLGGVAADLLVGGAGVDELRGGDGADVLRGGAGGDTLAGEGGDDLLAGGDGDDDESGGAGDDVSDQGVAEDGGDDLAGGPGFDLVAYDLRSQDLTVILDGPAVSGEAGEGDAISTIEGVLGGSGDDALTGNGSDNVLRGGPGADDLVAGGGDDQLVGGPGPDDLVGGAGGDTAGFFGAAGSVEADLAAGWARVLGEEDTLEGIEHLDGSRYGDVLLGDDGSNVLTGRGGVDRLVGRGGDDNLDGGGQRDDLRGGDGADLLLGREGGDRLLGGGGDDTLRGGPGEDTADFRTSSTRVVVNLASGSASGHGTDILSGIENLVGSSRGDELTGNGRPNVLDGGRGNDAIRGLAGADTLVGGAGRDLLIGGPGSDLFDQGSRKDGPDVVRGGGGRDLVSYARRTARVVVTLDGRANDGERGERDRLDRGVEDVRGGRGGDLLVGDGKDNTLRGGPGHDRLRGLGGRDLLVGGPGRDILDGGPGRDRCRGGPGRNEVIACER